MRSTHRRIADTSQCQRRILMPREIEERRKIRPRSRFHEIELFSKNILITTKHLISLTHATNKALTNANGNECTSIAHAINPTNNTAFKQTPSRENLESQLNKRSF